MMKLIACISLTKLPADDWLCSPPSSWRCIHSTGVGIKDAIVVASETDILVLLTYHWKENMAEIHIKRAALLLWSSFQ